ncbi:ABC transporter permease [Propionicimonas sp.]|uniref:ABC transporter permease n=1 Tax=Propionicimonas sp. TaxID=1955623 RepID=UPI0039E2ED6F
MAADHRTAARRRLYLTMLLRSVARRRSRVLVAALAIAIGATTLTGLATILIDIPAQLGRELRSYGANLVVTPSGDSAISASDQATIDGLVGTEGLLGRAAYRYETVRINEQPWTAAGTDLAGVPTVRPYWAVTGAWPGPGEVLIGRDVATTTGLGVASTALLAVADADGDDQVTPVRISGVLDTGDAEDGFVVMSADDLQAVTGTARGADLVEYSLTLDADALAAVASRVEEAGLGVDAAPVKRLARSETTVLSTLNSLLGWVVAIVLVLVMITVATTMMAVVTERRTEIGLKKALGADERSIAADFLGEGLLLGAAGGLLGGVAGLGFAELVSLQVFGRSIGAAWWLVAAAVCASVLVAGVACLVPVRRAMRVEPAVVLRGE